MADICSGRIPLPDAFIMDSDFKQFLFEAHKNALPSPSPQATSAWVENLLGLLFPERAKERILHKVDLENLIDQSKLKLCSILEPIVAGSEISTSSVCSDFFEQLPKIYGLLIKDAEAIGSGDPAAISQMEVVLTYPGFFALSIYRMAHEFCHLGLPIFARLLTEYAHQQTGIDIHPGAKIGERFCIDHGTGIVIGGTSVIGNDVKMYQGVTLGALSVKKSMAATKRHPTIQDRVVIYAGATILGGDTIIGNDSIIGGNVWLTKSVPEKSRIYYQGHTTQRIQTQQQS